jgi:hypothetical protein
MNTDKRSWAAAPDINVAVPMTADANTVNRNNKLLDMDFLWKWIDG